MIPNGKGGGLQKPRSRTDLKGPPFLFTIMNKTFDKLPEKNVEVLVFDARNNRWKIAKLVDHNNVQMWVQDPKLFYGLMPERFTHWMLLPEIPNG